MQFEGAHSVIVITVGMNPATRFQILNKAVYISHGINTPGKTYESNNSPSSYR